MRQQILRVLQNFASFRTPNSKSWAKSIPTMTGIFNHTRQYHPFRYFNYTNKNNTKLSRNHYSNTYPNINIFRASMKHSRLPNEKDLEPRNKRYLEATAYTRPTNPYKDAEYKKNNFFKFANRDADIDANSDYTPELLKNDCNDTTANETMKPTNQRISSISITTPLMNGDSREDENFPDNVFGKLVATMLRDIHNEEIRDDVKLSIMDILIRAKRGQT